MGRGLFLGLVSLAATASLASAAPAKQGGIFLVGKQGASVQIDPQVAYVSTAWWLEYATATKLYNYPDKAGQAGGLLRPEVASGYTVSQDGKTYTFTIRKGYRFSDGTPVTARNFKYAIDRAANHDLNSPAAAYITDPNGTNIVGAKAVSDGGVRSVSGVRVRGNKLVIHLTRADGAFLSKITMPFFQATSLKLPLTHEVTEAYPSAGPYYFSRNEVNTLTSLRKNPHWHGPRARHLSGVDVYWRGAPPPLGSFDLVEPPVEQIAQLAARFGVNKSRFWSMPTSCVAYIAFNNREGVFAGNPQLRKAVNWALDRRVFVEQAGLYSGKPWTHLLGPSIPGSILDRRRQPYTPGPDVAKARELAKGHLGDGTVTILYGTRGSNAPDSAELLRDALIRLGFEPANVILRSYFDGPGGPMEPQPKWDLVAAPFGWCQDYPDGYDIFQWLLLGHEPYALGSDAGKYRKKLAAVSKLTGSARAKAFGELDLEVMREVAPMAPVRTYNSRFLFSDRVDPRSLVYQPVYADWSIPALSLK